MQRRHLNIPIEIVRTVIAITEFGSLTKAAEILGMSQPAVSSQIKRLEQLVGGSLFTKTPTGRSPTDLGRLVVTQARKMIEANDQVLALGGTDSGPDRLRLGLSSLLVRDYLQNRSLRDLADVHIHSGNSAEISAALIEGHTDVACFYQRTDMDFELGPLIVDEFEDQLIWVRSKSFVLSPGAPIPIVTWTTDDWMISTLTRKGLSYRIAFSGQDSDAKKAAVEAGIGLSALPRRLLPPSLIHAREYYLPELPSIKTLLCIRPGLKSQRVMEIRSQLAALFLSHGAKESDKVA
jgi:DNA-binding transcriptional LysR family regulator